MEHYVDLRRALRDRSNAERKYQILSKLDPHNTYFFLNYYGMAKEAYAREQLAIRVIPTKTNKKERKRAGVPMRPSRPLHKWQRERMQSLNPGENQRERAVRLNFSSMVIRSETGPTEEDSVVTPLSYEQLYD